MSGRQYHPAGGMVLLLLGLLVLACGGDGGGGGPGGTGFLTVSVTTTGAVPDPDGYEFAVDAGAGQPVAPTAQVTTTIGTGAHDVSLSGVAGNCGANPVTPKRVNVSAGDTVQVTYTVTCPTPLTGPGVVLRSGSAVWSADTLSEVLLVDPGTGNGTPIGAVPVRAGGLMRLSPGRGRLAYASPGPAGGVPQLWTVNVDGTDRRLLLPDSGIGSWPLAWSPDGLRLAVWSASFGGGVAIVNSDGGGFRFLGPRGQVIGASPPTRADWSPDGRTIAFVNTTVQFSVGISGYDPVTRVFRSMVLPTTKNICCLRWSPDGQWLAFGQVEAADTLRPTSVSVRRVRASGGPIDSVVTVGTLTGIDWSPQGDQLLLEIGVAPAFLADLFVVDTNGTGLHNVTNTPLVPEDGANWLP